jgi:hypothetical protein
MHVTRADREDKDRPATKPDCGNSKNPSTLRRFADRTGPLFKNRVFQVGPQTRPRQKQILNLGQADAMLLAFGAIARVPIETVEIHGNVSNVCTNVNTNRKDQPKGNLPRPVIASKAKQSRQLHLQPLDCLAFGSQ